MSDDIEKKDNKDVPDVEKGCIAEEFDMSVKEVQDALPTNIYETPPKKDLKNKSRDRGRHTVHVSKEFDTCISLVYSQVSILIIYYK